ncbi:MAG TPA: nucleoside 2-deoxyribosyltransferase [Dongiaceae bacterium]|nr:nucleoside 2-deoxyribosyltransferase [Dongiaceae bacterium]
MRSCYLAGPDVFHPQMAALAAGKRQLCTRYGLQGRFPLDNESDLTGLDGRSAAMVIYRANIRLIESCDFLIANLTPFRGVSADTGTVFELGYMAARGKPVAAYSLSDITYRERVAAAGWLEGVTQQGRVINDRDGQMVEDFRLGDNLMLPGALVSPDGVDRWIIRPGDWRQVDDHLAAFELCLQSLVGATLIV